MVKKADYSKIAEYYDRGRTSAGPIIDLWMGLIAKYVQPTPESQILDIGCGTGRFTLPMANRFNCRVTGADSSREMLEKAREKDRKRIVQWDVQDIQNMTYDNESFDAVFMSHLLHHCESPKKALRECHRILKGHGTLLIRYGATEHIREDVEHTFFPETLAIDEARTQSIQTIEKWLKDAGFYGVTTEEVEQRTFETGKDHLEAAKIKNTSVLGMISQEAFDYGIQKLAEYVEENPNAPWLLYDRFGLTVGCK